MSNINKVQKTDYTAKKIDYTSRDYNSILQDLIDSIPSITKKWNSTDENDPGMVLIKLIAQLGDMLNYQQDMETLELYPNTVTLRKNASTIYKLIGYKMKWYRSATLEANFINTFTKSATLPRFCTFTTNDNSVIYTTFNQYELPSNTSNNGTEVNAVLVEGTPITPVRNGNISYAQAGQNWHSIYDYNYSTDDIDENNRIYLPDDNIDQNHIIIVDDTDNEWIQKDNIYLTQEIGRLYEFDVDSNNKPYIEFINYYSNYNPHKFKIFYIKSSGESGQIYANTLSKITGNIWSSVTNVNGDNTYDVSEFIKFTHHDSSFGYNPETPNEARKESTKYINTLNTLITLTDFEKAVLRIDGVINVRATDLTNDPGLSVEFALGDLNQDGSITQDDFNLLRDYLANPIQHPLTSYQLKLADTNQDGTVDNRDLQCIRNYLDDNVANNNSGYCGIQKIQNINLLDSFVVKLYILLNENLSYDLTQADKEKLANDIKIELHQYKVLPLTIEVDFDSIAKYYWTIKGVFYTREPLERDELQNIIININKELSFKYSLDKVNFNTAINYRDVLETIMNVDKRILNVDLDAIEYHDSYGNVVKKEDLIGSYSKEINAADTDKSTNAEPNTYKIKLDKVPILPGSLMIRVNNGEYILRDNNNEKIYNSDNVMTKDGTVNYLTGEITLNFTAPLNDNLIIDYKVNKVNIANYRNLSTQTFFFDSTSLKQEN